tara:strand:+ start:487 stop:690 length:204 start_codon:yes stop_codon:yes gene_type:complete
MRHPMNMDARKYDRLADLLSQVLWNYRHHAVSHNAQTRLMTEELRHIIHRALELNDLLADRDKQGLV